MSETLRAARDVLTGRARDYQQTFSGPVPERVLKDLAKFCRAHESTFNADTQLASKLDGRREVWLRIQKNLHLTDEQIFALYGVNDNG